jgi:hypothetical protein
MELGEKRNRAPRASTHGGGHTGRGRLYSSPARVGLARLACMRHGGRLITLYGSRERQLHGEDGRGGWWERGPAHAHPHRPVQQLLLKLATGAERRGGGFEGRERRRLAWKLRNTHVANPRRCATISSSPVATTPVRGPLPGPLFCGSCLAVGPAVC